MKTINKEVRNTINAVMDEFYELIENEAINVEYIDEMKHCEKCPLRNECMKNKYFFACGVWEEMMGAEV